MRNSVLVVLMVTFAAACTKDPPASKGAATALAVDDAAAGRENVAPEAAEGPDASTVAPQASCDALSERSRSAFEAQRRDLRECDDDDDCRQQAFYSDEDGCWASCEALHGNQAFKEATGQLAGSLCTDFHAQGCEVLPAGCPPVSSGEKRVPTCADGKCTYLEH